MSPATRRGAIGALGATALAAIGVAAFARPEAIEPATSPAPSADAALILNCDRFDAIEREIQAIPGDFWPCSPEEEAADLERDRLTDLQRPLLEAIVAHQATSAEGHRARARSLDLWLPGDLQRKGVDGGYWNDRLTWAVVRDLIGETSS